LKKFGTFLKSKKGLGLGLDLRPRPRPDNPRTRPRPRPPNGVFKDPRGQGIALRTNGLG